MQSSSNLLQKEPAEAVTDRHGSARQLIDAHQHGGAIGEPERFHDRMIHDVQRRALSQDRVADTHWASLEAEAMAGRLARHLR
jgi:hypothetical protein